MLTDIEIQEILNGNIENKNIDIKSGFTWTTKSHTTLEIIKDIMAMSNTQDGGKLIIGIDKKMKAFASDETNWFDGCSNRFVNDAGNRVIGLGVGRVDDQATQVGLPAGSSTERCDLSETIGRLQGDSAGRILITGVGGIAIA